MKPRLLVADFYYEQALSDILASIGDAARGYTELIARVLEFGFGTSGAIYEEMSRCGWDVHVSIANSAALQGMWIDENQPWMNKGSLPRVRNMRGSSRLHLPGVSWQDVLIRQVRVIQPDIVFTLDPNWLRVHQRRKIKSFGPLLVAQSAVPLGLNTTKDFDAYISSLPRNVELARNNGTISYYLPHAFWHRDTDRWLPEFRDIEVLFYGSVSSRHASTLELLQELSAKHIPVAAYCVWPEDLPVPANVTLHKPVWGPNLRATIARSKIVINRHMDYAYPYSNNMRMFEATGLGALLVTESSVNLDELFEPGVECIAYQNFGEAASVVEDLLKDEKRLENIASAGKRRTLSSHQYKHRTQELDGIFRDLIDMKRSRRHISWP